MILFCDSSALAKLYVQEEFSADLIRLAASANKIAVCRITWVELMAAFARRVRGIPSDAAIFDTVRERFQRDWGGYLVVEVSQPLVERAGELADTFALKGYDSVQLAAAQVLQAGQSDVVAFACFDQRLCKSAKVLGMQVNDYK